MQTIKNNCSHYTHKPGYAYPRSSDSCRGCAFSSDPALYDGGCTYQHGGNSPSQKGIMADVYRIYQKYEARDAAHNAKEIFFLSGEAARCLTNTYHTYFAYCLAQALVNHFIDRFNSEMPEAS